MTSFILRRLGQALLVMFGVATITFVLIRLAPGDPLSREIEAARLAPDHIARMQRVYGLDRPIHVQYLSYVGSLARGDLGISFSERRPVIDTLRDRLGNTVLLALAALLVDFVLGVTLGVWQAVRAGTVRDRFASVVSLAVYATPTFWLGMMFVLVFAVQLRWLPSSGAYDPLTSAMPLMARVWDQLRHLILPALTLGLVGAAGTARYQRAAFLEVVGEHFVMAARARGITEGRVMLVHALKNSLLPTITLLGLSLPILLSGAVLVESVFSWPGMGKWLLDAVGSRDYPVVTAGAIVASAAVVLGNLVADVLYRVADPRTGEAS